MKIHSLSFENIRNHSSTRFDQFAERVNVFVGNNGQGKTTILEAICIAALSKTFTNSSDSALVSNSKEYYSLQAHCVSDNDLPYSVQIRYSAIEKKQISTSRGKRITPAQLLGEIPVVVLSPDLREITFGGPQERRRLLDSVISQANKRYLQDITRLRQTLKQRNTLLSEYKLSPQKIDTVLIDTWSESLRALHASIALTRYHFLQDYSKEVQLCYSIISGKNEEIQIQYQPNGMSPESLERGKEAVLSELELIYRATEREEYRRGLTLLGPQKDELLLCIDGRVVRETASQGQHKSLLVAMKMAEYKYLREICGETPIFLLDDIFSELDSQRIKNVLEFLRGEAQIFITTTETAIYQNHFSGQKDCLCFSIDNGSISEKYH